jgi:hypothetical protein
MPVAVVAELAATTLEYFGEKRRTTPSKPRRGPSAHGRNRAGGVVMFKPHRGGRKQAHDAELRREATDYAEAHGAAAAGKRFGIPVGTLKSWIARRRAREAVREASDDGLDQIRREGQALVEKWEARVARELERYGPPPLAVGEYLSPDPYEGQRPPPGTPWPPVVPEPAAEEPVEDAVTSQLVPGEAASSSQLLNGEEPKPKKKRGGRNDDVV